VKKDHVFLEHILECIDRIEEYLAGIPEREFWSNTQVQDAVVRRLEVIGEAAKKISEPTRKKYPAIPWSKMAGMRDILIHEYFGVDYTIVWNTCKKSIPELKGQLKEVLKDLQAVKKKWCSEKN